MKPVPEEVVQEWATKKKYIQDRLNRIRKRLKKYSKQERHFEWRLQMIRQLEKKNGKAIKT
jgi:hypothetical protein